MTQGVSKSLHRKKALSDGGLYDSGIVSQQSVLLFQRFPAQPSAVQAYAQSRSCNVVVYRAEQALDNGQLANASLRLLNVFIYAHGTEIVETRI